jgi:hypothetical protein
MTDDDDDDDNGRRRHTLNLSRVLKVPYHIVVGRVLSTLCLRVTPSLLCSQIICNNFFDWEEYYGPVACNLVT